MKILIFTEGTILMHSSAAGHSRQEILRQVIEKDPSVKDYANYIPIGQAVDKISNWVDQGAEIFYLTSRRQKEEINQIQNTLDQYNFPRGSLVFRAENEEYKDVAERVKPNILIEDDCESIGGEIEMTYPHIKSGLKAKIKSIVIKEFSGIDNLSNNIVTLRNKLV